MLSASLNLAPATQPPISIAQEAAKLRRRMERAVERLINALDALDAPESELEDGGDSEPWLGSGDGAMFQDGMVGGSGGTGDDREQEDEHGGDILNEPHDPEPDREPSLGSTEGIDQQLSWTAEASRGESGEDREGPEDDLEPSGGDEPEERDESHDGRESDGMRILGGIGA